MFIEKAKGSIIEWAILSYVFMLPLLIAGAYFLLELRVEPSNTNLKTLKRFPR